MAVYWAAFIRNMAVCSKKEKTRAREIRGLLTASKHTRCDNLFLITDVERTEFEKEGKLIKIIPAYEWLIG